MSKQEHNQANAAWRGIIEGFRNLIDSGKYAELSGSAFKVWGILARRADPRGCSYPGLTSIARDSGLNRMSVIRAIKELEKALLLKKQTGGSVEGSRRTTNHYQLFHAIALNDQSQKSNQSNKCDQSHPNDSTSINNETPSVLNLRPELVAKPRLKETHTSNPDKETQEEGKNSSSLNCVVLLNRLVKIAWGTPQRRRRAVAETPELIDRALKEFDQAIQAKEAQGEIIANKGGFFGGILKNLEGKSDDVTLLKLPSAITRDESFQDKKLRILQQAADLLSESKHNQTVNTQHTEVITNAATQ